MTYLWAAYVVVFVALLAWLGIIQLKLQRLDRELADLAERARERRRDEEKVPVG